MKTKEETKTKLTQDNLFFSFRSLIAALFGLPKRKVDIKHNYKTGKPELTVDKKLEASEIGIVEDTQKLMILALDKLV